jgi:Flp pilus assembly pilin Flp
MPASSLYADSRGGVLVEYVILAALVGVVVAISLAAIGPATVRNYSAQRAALYLSNP